MTKHTDETELASLLQRRIALKQEIGMLDERISCLMNRQGNSDFTYDPNPNFTADERKRLNLFNQRMAEIETKMREVYQQVGSEADTALAQWNHCLHDYELGGMVTLHLREDDPAYREDDDNIMAERTLTYPMLDPESIDDYWESYALAGKVVRRPHCYLFHDFVDHDPDNNQQVCLTNFLRTGSAWIDVVVTYQYWLDIDSGEWKKPRNRRSEWWCKSR